ncbi:hypothetical protein NQ315_010353 [Exocentrus adspersus]|uniref:Uncharacterized protein n=1 Tax=Exocentrus adspersus TaxID=1586481 RepID=A0AAV8WDJ0_9CUCU|nr:hypothetical protein NQ315_010353 [Exocentrus adspersus]
MKHLYLLVATAAVALAATPFPSKTKNCIEHCKCKKNDLPSRLQVIECDRPLVLNETTFRNVNKQIISTVSLQNVIIDQIQESVFKSFKVLEDVLILNTKIGAIDAKSFNYVKRLKFSDCGFEDTLDLFSEKLEELYLANCQIEQIPVLNGLFSLRFLSLTGNYIKDIDIETFAELFDLQELYLSNNEIFKIPPTLFINNVDLNSLYLDNNPLKHFYLNTSTEDLETLSLSNCQLETFDERSTERLSTLSELNLSNNKIKSLSGKAMSHMKSLSVINLANNKLEQLDDDIFAGNPGLYKITLDGNNFKTLPSFYLDSGEVFTTYTFSCNHCGLKSLPGTVFKNMPGVVDLQLSNNEFANVDNMFQYIPSLKMLDISHNNIVYISPLAFANNTNLEALNVAGNPLLALNPEVFAHTRVISEVDARNASLKMLWSNKNNNIPSLHKLLLSGNQLSSLTIEDFKVTPNLIAIDLSNNPLQFTEDFCKGINWMDKKQIRPIEYSQELDELPGPYIENPKNFDGFTFTSWSEFYNNKCPDVSTTTPGSWEPASDVDIHDNVIDDSTLALEYEDEDDDDVDEDDDDEYNYDDEMEADEESLSKYVEDRNSNLAKASYILSVTSVFILTALVVLTLAVTITLTILRRNNNFNMHKANLPRLKIPMWHSTPGQKKHSGSVYRPLSEDLSGPKTPKLSRYEFTSTPTVHSSNP